MYADDFIPLIASAQHPFTGEEGAAKGHETALERLLHPHADQGRRHGCHLLDGAAGALLQLRQTGADQPQRQAGGQHDMAAIGHAALLHHAADLAGQFGHQRVFAPSLFIKQTGDIGGAKFVGIAAELRQLWQAYFTSQDAAVGEAGVGGQIGRGQRRMEVAKAFHGGEQQGIRDRGIGDAGAGIWGEPGALEGADGGQALVVGLVVH